MFASPTAIKKPDLTTDNMSYVKSNEKDRDREMSSHFWNSVDEKLKEAHMSRSELARRAKLSGQSLTSAKYLKTNITIFTALRITKALGCTIEDLIYGHADQKSHRDDEYSSLAEEVTEEAGTCEISALAEVFGKLTRDAQLAVLVHVLNLLGLSVRKIIEKIDDESIEGENK